MGVRTRSLGACARLDTLHLRMPVGMAVDALVRQAALVRVGHRRNRVSAGLGERRPYLEPRRSSRLLSLDTVSVAYTNGARSPFSSNQTWTSVIDESGSWALTMRFSSSQIPCSSHFARAGCDLGILPADHGGPRPFMGGSTSTSWAPSSRTRHCTSSRSISVGTAARSSQQMAIWGRSRHSLHTGTRSRGNLRLPWLIASSPHELDLTGPRALLL